MRIDDVVKEIREFADAFKKRNGNSSLRIPNKDFNLWMINWMIKQDGRLNNIEIKQKLLMWFFGITIALISLFQII